MDPNGETVLVPPQEPTPQSPPLKKRLLIVSLLVGLPALLLLVGGVGAAYYVMNKNFQSSETTVNEQTNTPTPAIISSFPSNQPTVVQPQDIKSLIKYNTWYLPPIGKTLKNGDIIEIEGTLSRPVEDHDTLAVFEGPHNHYCFKPLPQITAGSIIKIKARVDEAKKWVCTNVTVLESHVLYSREQLQELLTRFEYICRDLQDDMNQKQISKYPVTIDCREFKKEYILAQNWAPSTQTLAVKLYPRSQSGTGSCFDMVLIDTNVLIDLKTLGIKEIDVATPQYGTICQ